MAEDLELRELLDATIREWCAARGGGWANSWVFAMHFTESDGGDAMFVTKPERQMHYISMGLSDYLRQWYTDDAVATWHALYSFNDDEDD